MWLLTLTQLTIFTTTLALKAGGNSTTPITKLTIDTRTRYQTIVGFGISQAFQRARQVHGNTSALSSANSQRVIDLLFSQEHGAGLTILRNGIGSSPSYALDWMKSIEPASPGSPNATPVYEWDGDDAGQVWLTKEAMKRGVAAIYADAWSVPGYMKSNGQDSNGGYICGVSGTSCASGDWRQAYANYLVQYLRFYKEREGVAVKYLGFLNEPDLNQTYASMQSSGFQAADFLKVLRSTLSASNFSDVQIVCCEATGWSDSEDLLAELKSVAGAEDMMDVFSAHGYSSHPALPLNTTKPVWQTEWADLDGRWNTAWDNLGKEGEGISWANKIQQGLTLSNMSAFFYWIGAEQAPTNSALINLQNDTISVSTRLWAFAQFSRFVKPGAVRVEAKSDVGYVRVSAFENSDGKIAIEVINNGHTDVQVEVELWGVSGLRESATPWLTNNQNDLKMLASIPTVGDHDRVVFKASVMERSMVSFVL
ncbi:glycoside hydrolase family 30 protein [Melanomma pulvis-pyrius CBS 109.77]|uniref:Glycoside hydrolase family 30 protein n=1 Tax=Melanomma pulvis-pyrius CBS 109.77 TaxID=1314802 RepID=A0A6A6X2U0_9PLEO|nr:glycoside hydrolase family 30 protein [Melanomma pulvis-pyrius CBS 109.77]